jgi:hypothetical protein
MIARRLACRVPNEGGTNVVRVRLPQRVALVRQGMPYGELRIRASLNGSGKRDLRANGGRPPIRLDGTIGAHRRDLRGAGTFELRGRLADVRVRTTRRATRGAVPASGEKHAHDSEQTQRKWPREGGVTPSSDAGNTMTPFGVDSRQPLHVPACSQTSQSPNVTNFDRTRIARAALHPSGRPPDSRIVPVHILVSTMSRVRNAAVGHNRSVFDDLFCLHPRGCRCACRAGAQLDRYCKLVNKCAGAHFSANLIVSF